VATRSAAEHQIQTAVAVRLRPNHTSRPHYERYKRLILEVVVNTKTLLFALIALCPFSVALADSPFDGTWKLDPAKSHLTGDTMTFEDAGNGSLKYTDSAQTYTFKPDGSSFTVPLGQERTMQKSGDNVYTSTVKLHGSLLRTGTWTLSSDGKKLIIESKGTKPNGDSFDDATTFMRTSPGTGLVGGWKSTHVKLSSPNAITINTDGNDVTLTISAIKATVHAKWDGKDYPASGPTVSDGVTLALTKTGPNSFKLVQKANAKVLAIVHYRAASDGQTLTTKGTNGEGKEPFTEVFNKQS
jgi:hypothetical protein